MQYANALYKFHCLHHYPTLHGTSACVLFDHIWNISNWSKYKILFDLEDVTLLLQELLRALRKLKIHTDFRS